MLGRFRARLVVLSLVALPLSCSADFDGIFAVPGSFDATLPDVSNEAAVDSAQDSGPPTKMVLKFTWQRQSNDSYSGPGATRIALSTRLATLPSQADLASFMGTDDAGTDYIGLPVKALNKWLSTTRYKEVDITDPATAAMRTKLKADIVALISAGWPIVANVLSGWRPSFYPSGTIYHYLTIVGYDEGGDTVLIADPGGEGTGDWAKVPRSYWLSTYDLGTWIAAKGYSGR